MAWTEEMERELLHMWQSGRSASEIANAISTKANEVTRNAVIGKIHRLGLAREKRKIAYRHRKRGDGNGKPRKPAPAKREARPAKPAWNPPPKVLEPAPEGGVHLLDIREGQCRWPGGDPRDLGSFRFCGATTEVGSYCLHHHRMSRGSGTIAEQNALKKIPA